MKKNIYLFVLLMLASGLSTKAQDIELNSIELISGTSDSVLLKMGIQFYSSPVYKKECSIQVNFDEKRIDIDACYRSGPAAALDYIVDTFNLGILEDNVYDINALIGAISGSFQCYEEGRVDSTAFSINITNGDILLNNNSFFQEETVKIINHSVEDELVIKNLVNKVFTISVYSRNGQLQFSKHVDQLTTTYINVGLLNAGIYLCAFHSDERLVSSDKFFKK